MGGGPAPLAPEAEPYDPAGDNIEEWVEEMTRQGYVIGERLGEPSTATTVTVRQGKTQVRPGPFAETRGWIAGFDVLECPDQETAIAAAAKHPMARFGRIEVRPFRPFEGN